MFSPARDVNHFEHYVYISHAPVKQVLPSAELSEALIWRQSRAAAKAEALIHNREEPQHESHYSLRSFPSSRWPYSTLVTSARHKADFAAVTFVGTSECIEMSARDLIEGEAELDDEENDESFDEETGEVKKRTNGVNGHLDDSSEEEEDDDDEDAARAVRLET